MAKPALVERKTQIHHLWDKHHQVLRLIALGNKDKDIAEAVGMTPMMISTIRCSNISKDILSVMRGALDQTTIDIAKEIGNLAPRAVKVLEELMDSENERIQLSAAVDVLDRAGYAAQKNLKVDIHNHVTQADIDDIKRRAVEAGMLALDGPPTPAIVEGEFTTKCEAFGRDSVSNDSEREVRGGDEVGDSANVVADVEIVMEA